MGNAKAEAQRIGGTPAVEPIPFARPDVTDAECEAVVEALRSGWTTTGPRTKQLERTFAETVGAKYAVAVNSCTAALHLALEAVGVTKEHEVIVPTMTFAATAEVVRYLDAKPVLVDSRGDDHQVDVDAVRAAVTDRTKAIVPVHFAGAPCDMAPIMELACERGIKVIDDAAHSVPATYRGEPVGSLADITCFSFYATKPLSTGEGGMATTDDAAWAERMQVMSLHGISKDAWKRYSAEGSWYYEIVAPGYKYNMTDIAASLGLVQLGRLDEMTARRAAIAARYSAAFADESALSLPVVHDDRSHAWHLYVIRLQLEALRIDRARFIEVLRERGVASSVHFIPLHIHPYYRETYGYKAEDLPVAYDLYQRSVSLPIYSTMSDAQVDRVVETVNNVLATEAR